MTNEIWIAILSSTLCSAMLGGVVAGTYLLRGKRNDYVNEYFKTITERRLEAYERLEKLIGAFKIAIIDEADQRSYHFIFGGETTTWTEVYKLFLDSTSQPLWLSREIFSKTRELNLMIYQASISNRELVEFAKENYSSIAELRDQVEQLHATDMLNLHDVKSFLKKRVQHRDNFEFLDFRS